MKFVYSFRCTCRKYIYSREHPCCRKISTSLSKDKIEVSSYMTETRIESRRIYHIILKLPFWKSNCNFCLLQTGGEQERGIKSIKHINKKVDLLVINNQPYRIHLINIIIRIMKNQILTFFLLIASVSAFQTCSPFARPCKVRSKSTVVDSILIRSLVVSHIIAPRRLNDNNGTMKFNSLTILFSLLPFSRHL